MKDKPSQKGVALLMVVGLSLVLFIGLIGLFFVLTTNLRNLEALKERTEAYYLCETGASVAILDIAHGKIGSGPNQWTTRTFNYRVGDKTYSIKYTITKTTGVWQIISEVAGFNRPYKLTVVGIRAFPIFIRGFAGK